MRDVRNFLPAILGGVVLLVCGCGAYESKPGVHIPAEERREFYLGQAEPRDRRFEAAGFANMPQPIDPVIDERRGQSTEPYELVNESPFLSSRDNPLSTFAVDVDTASYTLMRKFLNRRALPPTAAVRIEEMVNYFSYEYPTPAGNDPFSVNVEVAGCPWQPRHRLLRVALKGAEVSSEERPLSNLVFLLDVSGSMKDAQKLPMVQSAMRMLVNRLEESDRVAIVVYAGTSGVVLPSISAANKEMILSAINGLHAEGSTNGGSGIRLAYEIASQHFLRGGVNRVILCTDGDFNVGTTSQSELVKLIEEKAQSGVFLTVLGFGMGNYKDATMEKLADRGNGNYAYVDNLNEAKKVLIDEMGGTLVTIAKDVKIQLDFNPTRVAAYRLIGYNNRLLQPEDLQNDAKDAGEIGAGHTVTALYELVPAGEQVPQADYESSKYQQVTELTPAAAGNELLTVRLRYKEPDGHASHPMEVVASDDGRSFDAASPDFRFAASVAEFGLLLRNSRYRESADYDQVLSIASTSLGPDLNGYRAEFLRLVRVARDLQMPMEQARR